MRRPPNCEEITKITLCAETFVGIVRAAELGCPTSCIELYDGRTASIKSQTYLVDNDTASHDNEVDDRMKAGRQKLKIG